MEPDKIPCGNDLVDDSLQAGITRLEVKFILAVCLGTAVILTGIIKYFFF